MLRCTPLLLLLVLAACGGYRDTADTATATAAHTLSPAVRDALAASRQLRLDWRLRRSTEGGTALHYRLNDLPLGADDQALLSLRDLITDLQPGSTITIVPLPGEDGYPFDVDGLAGYAQRYQVRVLVPPRE